MGPRATTAHASGALTAPARPKARSWHTLCLDEALAALGINESGLSEAEATARREAFGANVLPQPRRAGVARIYLRQFKNPLVYLLLAATVVSLAVGEWGDAFFIFVVLQFNAAIGAYQEWRAETSAKALDVLVRKFAVVLRDGAPRRVEASELVPGDVVRLVSGALVPADLRLLGAHELSVDESLLTGESIPVAKQADAVLDAETPLAERRNMLYAGTTVLSGRVTGAVAATGRRTEIGRIAEVLARGEGVPPPLVVRLERFSRVIGVATLVLIGLLGAVLLGQGLPLATVFLVAVALAVAAIPEGLPVAITVALAIATKRMARRNVIVRALPAVEGLGACTLIACDKTGTLTCNELTIKKVRLFGAGIPAAPVEVGGEGYLPEGAVTIGGRDLLPDQQAALERLAATGTLCNEAALRVVAGAVEHLGDTVDVAFLVLAVKLGLDPHRLHTAAPQVGIIPYEPQRRFAVTFTREEATREEAMTDPSGADTAVARVKGAAEIIVPMCDGIDRARVLAEADRMAADGYRVLAVACGSVPMAAALAGDRQALRGLELLGLVGLIDPVRPEVPSAVSRCRAAGIDVRMVTGDHPGTALAIARELDMEAPPDNVVTGTDLAAAGANGPAFDRLVAEARVFARVEPVQKLAIVQALQRHGHTVAVTGDGVNDAPALSAADIGVAMARDGTDAARGAADLLLADDNFASIVAGVEEGRVAYANVRKLIFLLIATGLGEIVLFLLSIGAGFPLPLSAVQLLWLNLVTNGIQDVALAFERGEPGVLDQPPRSADEPLFERLMIAQVLVAGVYMGAAAFAFYAWSLERGMDEAMARNLVLLLMVLFENAHALNARSETRSVLGVPVAANPFLIVAILGAQGLHIAAMYLPGLSGLLDVQPIGLGDWVTVAAIAVSLILVMEIFKCLPARRMSPR
jgi:Ca2+-transporting ATPase